MAYLAVLLALALGYALGREKEIVKEAADHTRTLWQKITRKSIKIIKKRIPDRPEAEAIKQLEK